MPPKRKLVPPLRPNADGTGFVRAGRAGAGLAPPSRAAAPGGRQPVSPSTSSESSAASSSSSAISAANASRSSSSEAAAACRRGAASAAAAASRGRHGRPDDAPSNRRDEKMFPATKHDAHVAETKEGSKAVQQSKQPSASMSSASARSPAPTITKDYQMQRAKVAAVPSPLSASANRQAAAPSGPSASFLLEIGIDAALGPSECLASSRVLQRLGVLNGSLVQLSTIYGEVYAELRQTRSAAAAAAAGASDRVFVNDDAAAVLVDKQVRLHPVELPSSDGLPVLTALTLRPVAPESTSRTRLPSTEDPAVTASLSATSEWQAMFRRALHHKVAYLHLRTTQRILTHRLALEVVKVETSLATEASASISPPWGIVTDQTVLNLEGGRAVHTEAPPVTAQKESGVTTAVPVPAAPSLCTLVVGEPGTGKSRWLKQCSGEMPVEVEERDSPHTTTAPASYPSVSRYVEWVRVEVLPQGDLSDVSTATALREVFERARQSAPALILMDDLHLVCARETSSAGSRWAMSFIAHTLAEELLDIQQHQRGVKVVASAPSLDSLDGCLTGTSLFGGHVVTLEMPTGSAERLRCLRTCLQELCGASIEATTKTNGSSRLSVSGACLQEVAERAHGFTQRDVHRLAETAIVKAFHARQSVTPQDSDLRAAAAIVHPSSLKRFEVSVPSVRWGDIGGSAEAKRTLCDVVEWCLGKQRWIFADFNLTPPKGVLLYGPPGCSKTMLAKALANESHMNFISVKGPEVFSKWVGDSEKAVRDIFERARAASPCVVFIDELDGMCGHRGRGGVSDRVISQFLTELDGLPAAFEEKKNALVFVAATNRPDSIDGAVLRPGRIDRRVYVGLPTLEERAAITEIQFKHLPVGADVTVTYVAEHTEGYTGAEVVAVVKEAAFHAITADAAASYVTLADVEVALQKVRPRIQPKDVEWYKRWPHNAPPVKE